MAANEKRQNDRQRKDSINAAKAREAERNRQQEKLRNEARVKREREEEIRRRRQEAEDREQERIRRERFEVHAREAREREQQREAARAEKLRRARSDPTPFSRHDDDIETHDMTEDDEAWSARGVLVVGVSFFDFEAVRTASRDREELRVDGVEAGVYRDERIT